MPNTLKPDLDALERANLGKVVRPEDWMAVLAYARELERRVELRSMLLREQTDRLGAANLRIIELESASQPGGGEALAWIPEEAIAMLKPPLLLLTGVTLYRYDAVGTRALYLRAAPSAGNGGAEGGS